MYNSHNHIFECIKPGRRERGNGEQSSRGVGWVGTMAAVNSRDKNRLEKRSSRRAWCTFGRHFLSSASARCAVAHVRLHWRRRRRLVAVGENFLFSSLARQLGRRKGVFFYDRLRTLDLHFLLWMYLASILLERFRSARQKAIMFFAAHLAESSLREELACGLEIELLHRSCNWLKLTERAARFPARASCAGSKVGAEKFAWACNPTRYAMRNDHSIAGTTILQPTLEDADNTQIFIDGKTNPVVKVGSRTLRRFGVQHHRQSVAMEGKVGDLLFLSWLLTDNGVEHRNVLKSNYPLFPPDLSYHQ